MEHLCKDAIRSLAAPVARAAPFQARIEDNVVVAALVVALKLEQRGEEGGSESEGGR
jgi:hypothetical protein